MTGECVSLSAKNVPEGLEDRTRGEQLDWFGQYGWNWEATHAFVARYCCSSLQHRGFCCNSCGEDEDQGYQGFDYLCCCKSPLSNVYGPFDTDELRMRTGRRGNGA